MLSYILRRLLLVVPTLWAIITINFFIIQIAPGGPVEQAIAQLEGHTSGIMERFTGGGQEVAAASEISVSGYKGSRGLDPQVVEEITRRFGFDKPIHERYSRISVCDHLDYPLCQRQLFELVSAARFSFR